MLKFVCFKDDLLNAIIPAMYGVATRSSLPILEGLHIKSEGENIYVCGYDLEKGVRASFKANKIWEQGSAVFNAQQLFSIVRGLPEGEVVITLDKNGIADVVSYRTEIEIHTKSDETYPSLPRLSGNKKIKMKQSSFKKMVNQVIFAVGNNEQKPILKGVFFKINDNRLILTALDGFKLAHREYDFKEEDGVSFDCDMNFIVPGRSLTDLMKLMNNDDDEVTIELTERHLFVNFEKISFFTRLIEGEMIEYERFIPKNNKTFVTVETKRLIDSAERASLIMNEKAKTPVKFRFDTNIINVTCATVMGSIFDEVEVQTEGEAIELSFNVKYVLDALRACPEKIKIELSTPRSSMLITPVDDNDKFLYLVLPLSTKE